MNKINRRDFLKMLAPAIGALLGLSKLVPQEDTVDVEALNVESGGMTCGAWWTYSEDGKLILTGCTDGVLWSTSGGKYWPSEGCEFQAVVRKPCSKNAGLEEV